MLGGGSIICSKEKCKLHGVCGSVFHVNPEGSN